MNCRNKANNDELTGLANRARYMQKLSQCETVLRGTDTPASIFLLDLDGFKTVNDTLGHGAGDWVLVETAKRLKRVARRAEEVARLGGDEFTLFFINKGDEKEMAALADDILAEISKPYMWEGNRCDIGASIGFTVFDAGLLRHDQAIAPVLTRPCTRPKNPARGGPVSIGQSLNPICTGMILSRSDWFAQVEFGVG